MSCARNAKEGNPAEASLRKSGGNSMILPERKAEPVTKRNGIFQRLFARTVHVRTCAGMRLPASTAAAEPGGASSDDRAREAVSRFAGGVAHDLNNILLVVQGYAEMAASESQSGAPVGPLLEEVSRATGRATRLVRDLLIIGQNAVVSPRSLDLNACIAQALSREAGFEGRGDLFTWRPGAGVPRMMVDEALLERLLAVLWSWVREIGEARAVLRTEPTEETGARLVCELPQTVMPAEITARLFDPYLRSAGGGKGPGLRLSVVRAIAQLLGGTASAECSPAQGTRIIVSLPARPAAEPAPAAPPVAVRASARGTAQSEGAPGARAAHPGSILFAEDDESLRAIALKVLQREGYTVIVACDGQEAVELWEKNSTTIGLLLLDDVMPRMGGRAVLAKIRTLRPGIPAIMASGYAWSLDRVPGAADCAVLPKPWRPRELLEKVREQLETQG